MHFRHLSSGFLNKLMTYQPKIKISVDLKLKNEDFKRFNSDVSA